MRSVVVDDEARGSASATAVRAEVATALAAAPGVGLLATVQDLLCAPDELTARERLELVGAWDRLESFARAGKLTAIGDLDQALHPGAADLTGVSASRTANELAPVLHVAPRTASTLVGHARRVQSLPAALDAVADGRMTPAQLSVLDQVTRDLPGPAAARVEAEAVRRAPGMTRQQLHEHVAATAAAVDPGHGARAVDRGTSERDVQVRPSPLPGCHRIIADLPTPAAYAVWHAVNGAARAAKTTGTRPDGAPEDRTLAQLRADTFAATLTGHTEQTDLTGHTDPGRQGAVPPAELLTRLAQLEVVVGADTLTGASDQPGHLPGAGPIDHTTLRALAPHVPWRRPIADPTTGTLTHRDPVLMPPAPNHHNVATDDDGADRQAEPGGVPDPRLARLLADPPPTANLDYGTTRYRPPRQLRDHVHTRDATCIGPACHHATIGTQLDHTINYDQLDPAGRRGTTAPDNLGSPCIRWHNAKTHDGWQLQQPRPGHFIWTSPLGRTYTRTARPLLPGWRHQPGRPPP